MTARLPSGTRAFVLTVSDGVAAGVREDASGAALAERLEALGAIVERAVVVDDIAGIAAAVRAATAMHSLVVTTGGTGLTPRDVTPQAVATVLDYTIPGFGEAMRAAGRAGTPLADLSRSGAGVCGRVLVISVPGSPRGALESLEAIVPLLAHALQTLAGPWDHDAARRRPAAAYDPVEEEPR